MKESNRSKRATRHRRQMMENMEMHPLPLLQICQKCRRIGCVIPRFNLQCGITQPIHRHICTFPEAFFPRQRRTCLGKRRRRRRRRDALRDRESGRRSEASEHPLSLSLSSFFSFRSGKTGIPLRPFLRISPSDILFKRTAASEGGGGPP